MEQRVGRSRRDHPKSNQLWVSPNKIKSCLLGLFPSLAMHLFSRYGSCPVKNLRPRKRQKEQPVFRGLRARARPFHTLDTSGARRHCLSLRGGPAGVGTGTRAQASPPARRVAVPRARPPRSSRTHPRAALLHGGQHSQATGRPRAEVEEVQRRARRLLQEPVLERRVPVPPGVLGPPGPRGRRRCALEDEQQQQGEQRGSGARGPEPRPGLRLPAGLHGRWRASAALDGLREGVDGAGENKVAEGPSPRPRGGQRQGARSPLGSSAPPHSACPGSEPGRAAPPRRGAAGVRPGPRGRWGSGDSSPEGARSPGATPGPQPSSPAQLLSPAGAEISKLRVLE